MDISASVNMVKKGGKPGTGGGKKPPQPASGADDSFIVFSNSENDPKTRKPNAGSSSNTGSLSGPALAGEAPRLDVKSIIGGASWTGKLPVNILSEHCRKQKWEQPEYTRVC